MKGLGLNGPYKIERRRVKDLQLKNDKRIQKTERSNIADKLDKDEKRFMYETCKHMITQGAPPIVFALPSSS